jgi:hypothetical protein
MNILKSAEAALKNASTKLIQWLSQPNQSHTGTPREFDARETYRFVGNGLSDKLYKGVQQLITDITGKALPDVPPLVVFNTWHRQMFLWAQMLFAMLIGASICFVGGIAFIVMPFSWLLTAAAFRTMQVSMTHYSAHRTLAKPIWLNELLGELYSVISLTDPLFVYRNGHLGKHHGQLNRKADPDSAFLEKNGFDSGHSVEWYWHHLFFTLVNPAYYTRALWTRFRHNLFATDLVELKGIFYTVVRTVVVITLHGGLITLAICTDHFAFYSMFIAIPLLVIFPILSLFQNLTEHQIEEVPGQPLGLSREMKVTAGRFFGTAWDPTGKWAKTQLMGVLSKAWVCRLLVVGNTELASHDMHHSWTIKWFTESDKKWPMAPYVRAAAINDGEKVKETFGLRAALNHSFSALVSNKH